MKKLLLILLVAGGFASQAQQFYWEEKSTGFSNVSTTQSHISYANANTVWFAAGDGSGQGATYRQWGKSLDGGETWTNGPINLGSTSLGIGSIMAMSATEAYVAGFPADATAQGGVWRSTDGGNVWTKQPSASFNTGTDSFTNFVYMWDANVGLAQGDPASGYFEIYLTNDGGANWTRVPSANIPAPLTGEYGYVHNYDVVGNTMWFGTNQGRIYKSINQGLNWTVAASPLSDFAGATQSGSYTFRDQNEGVIISSDWLFYRTTDGGVTWNEETPTGTYRNFDVTYVPGTDNFMVCAGEDIIDGFRGSSYSVDGGLNWIDINLIDELPVDGGGELEFFDITHGLASGFNASSAEGGIWKWINTLATVDFQSTKAFTASPNPTSGMLEILGQNISQVAVYDILGKQVSNNNYSAINNVSLNLSALNSGVYMVKVTNAAGASSTIKVVKQ